MSTITLSRTPDASGSFSAEINAAIAAASTSGDTLVVDDFARACKEPIKLASNVRIETQGRARLIKDYDAPSNWQDAFIGQADPNSALDNVIIEGDLTLESAMTVPGDPATIRTGKMMALKADNSRILGLTIDTFKGGQAAVLAGDNLTFAEALIKNSALEAGTGGVRYVGGSGFVGRAIRIKNIHDDAIQCMPLPGTGFNNNLDIFDARYIDCMVETSARAFIVGLSDNDHPDGIQSMTASIIGVQLIGIQGRAADRLGIVRNINSSGVIRDVSLSSVTLDGSADINGAQGLLIEGPQKQVYDSNNVPVPVAAESLPVWSTRLDGVRVINPFKTAFAVLGPGVRGVRATGGCFFDKPRTAGRHTVTTQFGQDIYLDEFEADTNGGHGVLFGEGTNGSLNCNAERGVVRGLASGKCGVRYNRGQYGDVSHITGYGDPAAAAVAISANALDATQSLNVLIPA